jgi:PPOX class probable F420-dependent enzyme
MILDETTDFGQRAATHLRNDIVIWLTTVSPSGAPLPTPVWFFWDGADTVRVNSLPTARRVTHIAANPKVSLNFAGDGQGGDIVVLSGRAATEPGAALPEEYVDKYRSHMEGIGLTPEEFAGRYSEGVRVELTRVRGH